MRATVNVIHPEHASRCLVVHHAVTALAHAFTFRPVRSAAIGEEALCDCNEVAGFREIRAFDDVLCDCALQQGRRHVRKIAGEKGQRSGMCLKVSL